MTQTTITPFPSASPSGPYEPVPHVHDAGSLNRQEPLYDSADVYINNQIAALYTAATAKAGFAPISAAPPISPIEGLAQAELTSSYLANPDSFYNPQAAADGVKPNYPGTPDIAPGDVPAGLPGDVPPPTTAQADGIVPFLTQLLQEAALPPTGRRAWAETGMGGRPSNQNIVNIWRTLGFPANNSYWQTDQTPWCMGFVNWVLKSTGYKFVQTASARAIRNYRQWGAQPVPRNQGQPGDIVLWTYSHVNFIYTANNGVYSFVGGNQTDSDGTRNNNPSGGSLTHNYKNGLSGNHNTIEGIFRPVRS